MTNNYCQKQKEKLQKEARERYQNISDKRRKNAKRKISKFY